MFNINWIRVSVHWGIGETRGDTWVYPPYVLPVPFFRGFTLPRKVMSLMLKAIYINDTGSIHSTSLVAHRACSMVQPLQ